MKKVYVLFVIFGLAINFSNLNASVKMNDLNQRLIESVRNKNIEEVRQLLQAGADVSVVSNNGNTAIDLASSLEIKQMLLGASLNQELIKAVRKKESIKTITLLLQKGADVSAVGGDGKTALILAVESRRKELARLLFQVFINTSAVKNGDKMGIDLASSPEIKQMLLSLSASVKMDDLNEELIRAVRGKNIDAVRLLLQAGTDVNAVSNKGHTALMYAARLGSKEMVELLLQAGADVNKVNSNNITALMCVAKSGCRETVEQLLRVGANVNVVRSGGETVNNLKISSEIKQKSMRFFVETDWLFEKKSEEKLELKNYKSEYSSQKGLLPLKDLFCLSNRRMKIG